MRFTVTSDDIRLGKRLDACNCPVARAVRRRLGLAPRRVIVYQYEGITVIDHGRRYESPPRVKEFILRLDNKGRRGLKPFAFDLPVPETKTRKRRKAK